MKKRLLAALLSLLLLLPLVSCQKTLTPDQLESWRKSTGWSYIHLAESEDTTTLRFPFPMEWKVKKGENALTITGGDTAIGEIYEGAPRDGDAMTLHETKEENGVTVSIYYGKLTRGDEKAPYYQFHYQYKTIEGNAKSITAEVKVDAMDAVAYKWLLSVHTAESMEVTPSLPLSAGNGKNAVLFLGNSFIGSSRVGSFFDALAWSGKKDCTVTAKSIGYATVTLYATQYTEWVTSIREGKYGIVFMCGFYGASDVTSLQTILDACNASNTRLVIFPAHNERDAQITAAHEAYPAVPLLNWKNEIDKYIDAGVPSSDLCINDEHLHSTPLAGYIGAAMAYRAVFGEEPPALPSGAPLSQSTIDTKIGSIDVKPTRLIPEKDISRLP